MTRQEEKGKLIRRFPAGDFTRRKYRGEIIMLRAYTIILIALLVFVFPLVQVQYSLMLVFFIGLMLLGAEWLNYLNCRTHGEYDIFEGGVEVFCLPCLFTLFGRTSEFIPEKDIERIETISQKISADKSFLVAAKDEIPQGLVFIRRDGRVRQLLDRFDGTVPESINLMVATWKIRVGPKEASHAEECQVGQVVPNDYRQEKFLLAYSLLLLAILLFFGWLIYDTLEIVSRFPKNEVALVLGTLVGVFMFSLFMFPYAIWGYYRRFPISFLLGEEGFSMNFRSGASKTVKWGEIVALALPSWEEVSKSKNRSGSMWLGHRLGTSVISLSPMAACSINAAYVSRMGRSPPTFDESRNKRLVALELRFYLVLVATIFLFIAACAVLTLILL